MIESWGCPELAETFSVDTSNYRSKVCNLLWLMYFHSTWRGIAHEDLKYRSTESTDLKQNKEPLATKYGQLISGVRAETTAPAPVDLLDVPR